MTTAPMIDVRQAYRVASFGTFTAAMTTCHALVQRVDTSRPTRDRWVGSWANGLLQLFNVDVRLRGAVPARPAGALVVSNHRSTIDIGLMLRTFGGVLVSRADLATWPVLGWAARTAGTIFVERGDTISGTRSVRMMKRLLESGDTVNIFPEGTTFADDTVRPFHLGAFVAVTHTPAVIVPVGIAYRGGAAFVEETFMQHLTRLSRAPSTVVGVCIGAPFDSKARARALSERTHEQVSRLVREARALAEA